MTGRELPALVWCLCRNRLSPLSRCRQSQRYRRGTGLGFCAVAPLASSLIVACHDKHMFVQVMDVLYGVVPSCGCISLSYLVAWS